MVIDRAVPSVGRPPDMDQRRGYVDIYFDDASGCRGVRPGNVERMAKPAGGARILRLAYYRCLECDPDSRRIVWSLNINQLLAIAEAAGFPH